MGQLVARKNDPWEQRAAAPHEEEREELDIAAIASALYSYKWLILCIVAMVVGLAALFVSTATPIYRADALIQVDTKSKPGISALKELQPLLGDSTSVGAELEILTSRLILGRAVTQTGLDINVQPRRFPVIGNMVARRHEGDGLREPLFGLSRYAWGGERIEVGKLDVSADRLDEPLTLVADGAAGYAVLNATKQKLFEGKIGQDAGVPGISLRIDTLKAGAGTEFTLVRSSVEEAISQLRASFSAKERTKQSGIIEITLMGPNRKTLQTVLNEIVGNYYDQNLTRRATEAENQLQFLESQLPALKAQLDSAESAYNAYRQSRGSVDIALETEGVLKSMVEVDTEIAKLKQEREELRQGFTPLHPRVIALDAKLKLLTDRSAGFGKGVAALPTTQQNALRLKRDVDVSNTLYLGLLSTAQQLRITKAGTVGEVRVIDNATVSRLPVEPKGRLLMTVAALGSLVLSMAIVWLLRAFRVTVEDPETIERRLALPVFATIPFSKQEQTLALKMRKSKDGFRGELLANLKPDDDAIEGLRSLRTTLHFALADVATKSILVTGPSQSVGKSFVAKNLAAVLAQSGKRVVLVDADLRRGHIHDEFGMRRRGGVSEYVTGSIDLAEAIRPTEFRNLSVVTTGRLPTNPADQLTHPRFGELLARLEERFDMIIIDAPPVLAVTDAAIIGRHAGATLLVARAGRHPLRELEQAVRQVQQAGVSIDGVVFNGFDVDRYRYGYGKRMVQYAYTSKST
ncbi:MAG: capsular exopolysaccharide family [Rhodoferax sp.]|nr:capsular exopolysaccharide family [Rhodoferax sp.]